MKIIELRIENFKKLTAVLIRPDGALVQITGENDNGKTSVLDALWVVLGGTKNIPDVPIRKGEEKALISADLGKLIVTRKFKINKKDSSETTTSLTVESKDGARFSSPQKMLDELIGKLTFDPLAFSRADPKEQFNTLKSFVPDVDFEAIEGKNKADYDNRTDINRKAKEARAAADAIPRTSGELEPVDEAHLITQLENVSAHNHDIEVRKENRAKMGKDAIEKVLRANTLFHEADQLKSEAHEIEVKLEQAGDLPKTQDAKEIRAKIDSAKDINRQIEERARQVEFQKEAADLEAQSGALTLSIDQRTAEKEAAIASAELPVEGITFGDGKILMDNLPFDQASDAAQLRTSLAIAMALNPKLRVIRVRHGNDLDEKSMKIVEEMAEGENYQIWIERVDSSGKVGFVLEDGHLKAAEEK